MIVANAIRCRRVGGYDDDKVHESMIVRMRLGELAAMAMI